MLMDERKRRFSTDCYRFVIGSCTHDSKAEFDELSVIFVCATSLYIPVEVRNTQQQPKPSISVVKECRRLQTNALCSHLHFSWCRVHTAAAVAAVTSPFPAAAAAAAAAAAPAA